MNRRNDLPGWGLRCRHVGTTPVTQRALRLVTQDRRQVPDWVVLPINVTMNAPRVELR
jgi:hypothetical protein